MPNIKSAAKRHRQSLRRRTRNRTAKSQLKVLGKQVREAAKTGDFAKAGTELQSTSRALDKAAANGIIHRNKAARLKSRLARAIKTAKTAPAPVAKPAKAPKAPKAGKKK